MRRIYPREEVCIGCKMCEVYCIVAHSQTQQILHTYFKETFRPFSRIRVEEQGPTSFALQCQQCEDPYCVYACINGAMYIDPDTGVVTHNTEHCIGCWSCLAACPYGAISQETRVDKPVVYKCDLCEDSGEPACVKVCPNEALILVEE